MAKRQGGRGRRVRRTAQNRRRARIVAKRSNRRAQRARKTARPKGASKAPRSATARTPVARGRAKARGSARTGSKTAHAVPKIAHLDRERRTLVDDDIVPTPPSSLGMDRHGTAASSGRAELAESLRRHGRITPGITGGDVDADFENAYFSGDEAPGGDNPTPDQEIVDDIGKALGVQYADNEELRSADKLTERDKHRWELDPASAEDYKDRK